MIKSETLNELFTAFSLFQNELENASKSKEGHNYKYADLAACIAQCKPLLGAQNLAVTQMLGQINGKQSMTTLLTHSSGQYIGDVVELPVAVLSGGGGKNPVQCLGSSITYMRRYAYASILGLTQEDDDGKGHVAPPSKPSANMQLILDAMANNDDAFVKKEWTGIIKSEWPKLTAPTVSKLNELFNK